MFSIQKLHCSSVNLIAVSKALRKATQVTRLAEKWQKLASLLPVSKTQLEELA